MPLNICSIASGSNGNCYYIGNDEEAILVDVGISCREIQKRMSRVGLSMDNVKAIFVSHEHSDHIRGLTTLANKYQLPVYLTEGTLTGCRLAIPDRLIRHVSDMQTVELGALSITSFRKYHDALDPHSFVIRHEGFSVGVFTDIGQVCNRVRQFFSECDAVFLESNYDEDLLANGRYPYFLKNRIKGGYGHLSNAQALALFLEHRSPRLSHLLLSHLSRDNNSPELVESLFSPHGEQTNIVVAGRYGATPVFCLEQPVNTDYSYR